MNLDSFDVFDGLAAAGALLIVVGVGFLFGLPAAVILAGILSLVLGILGATRWRDS